MVKALLAALFPPDYKYEVTQMVEMRAISAAPTKVLAIMAEVGKEQIIVELPWASRREMAGKWQGTSITTKASGGSRGTQGATQEAVKHKARFTGKCLVCGQFKRARHVETEARGQAPAASHQGAQGKHRPSVDVGGTLAQRTRIHPGKKNGDREGMAGANAILTDSGTVAVEGVTTATEGGEILMVPIPKQMLYAGAVGETATTVVETMVSQQAGSSMPPPVLQSASVLMLPEPSGPGSRKYSMYAHLSVDAAVGADTGSGACGENKSLTWCLWKAIFPAV